MMEVKLTGKNGGVALIDDEDAPISAFNWYLRKGYVVRRGDRLQMHRAVTHAPPGYLVDHRDGDRLNNTRANLRLVSPIINARNFKPLPKGNSSANFAGVTWHKARRKWQATIRFNGKLHYIGLFADLADAKLARCEAEVRLWGVEPQRRKLLESILGRTLPECLSDGAPVKRLDGSFGKSVRGPRSLRKTA